MILIALAAVPITFDAPWWLSAALAAPGPVLLAWRARRRGRHTGPSSLLLQCLAILAAALALAQPTAPLGESARRPWLAANDVSASLRGQEQATWTWPAGVPKEDFVFADAVAPAGQNVQADSTRIRPLLALVQARVDGLGGAVIRTDARFQDDDWSAVAAAVGRTHLPVWVIPADAAPADARLADLAAERRPDGKVQVRLSIAANAHQTRTIRLTRADLPSPLLERPLHLLAGETETLLLTDDPPADAMAVYEARLSGGDKFPENDFASVAVPASRRRALVIAGAGYSPAAALTSPALAVDQRPPSQAPADADGWRPYTAVCLADATGTALTAAQRAALARYVQDGGGLVILGSGPCGQPGDFNDPLNKAAPLVANPYQRRPLKVIVVLDASGSMGQEVIDEAGKAGGVRKFDVAVEAVQSLKQHLTPRDALTVIRFAETAALAYDSGAGPIDFGRLHAIDRRTAPAGSTKIKGALEMALGAVPGQGRDGLVLIVSDLETQDSDLPAADLAGQFRRAKLTVAAVVTSPDEQKQNASLLRFLEDLRADRIASERLTGLAELFGRYVRKARGEPVRRGAFTARGEGRVFGVADFSLPLTAYLPSAMKSDAAVLVQVGNDPVVAHRQGGLGKVVSIAVPVDGKDNAALGDSPALALLLARAVAWSARPEGDPRFSGQIVDRGRGRRLTVTAADGAGPMDSLALTCAAARTTGQEETPRSFPLRQTAPGRYEADLPPSAGPETLQVATGDGRVVWWTSPPHRAASEFAAVGADWEALRRLADLTGGRLLPAGRLGDLPAHVKQASASRQRPLWPWLLALAAAAMLADWCTARVLQRGK